MPCYRVLSESIYYLVMSVNIRCVDHPIVQLLLHEIFINFNMFSYIMLNGVVSNIYG